MYVSVVPFHRAAVSTPPENLYPFMNNMDEITYWIYTKRAPCLMNYDNLVKKQAEVAHGSKDNAISVTQEVPLTKKKRKLSLYDTDSVSTEKPLNVFQTSQNKKGCVLTCKSDSRSDLDFDIKKSSVKQKTKRSKILKSKILQKKNKVITSTPKATSITLRRSLRQAQLNNSHLNSYSEIFHSDIKNGTYQNNNTEKIVNNSNKNCHTGGDQSLNQKKIVNEKLKNQINGQFEDLSDVSGFTANYIRSAKAQSNKNPGKLRCKESRNLVKQSKHSQKDSAMIICTNKGVNTGLGNTVLNCTTDSEQHVINLVSTKNNEKTTKVNRGTSILKFMDTKRRSKEIATKKSNMKLNISFQSDSLPRYPKRHKATMHTSNLNNNTTNISSEFNNSDRKENPEEKLSRTRSGCSMGLRLRQPANSVLVLSNSTEQVSSLVSMNVATPEKEKKKKRMRKQVRTRLSEKRDFTKEHSGFAECFSDSDDSEPLQRKFFGA